MNGSSMRIRVAAGLCAAALVMGGCSNTINSSATLVDIDKGKDKITTGYGNFVAHLNQAQYDVYYVQFYGNTHYWSNISEEDEGVENAQTTEEKVKDNIMDELKENYLSTEHAPEYNVEITDKEKKDIDKAAKEFMEDNSEEAIKAMGATEEYLTEYLTGKTYSQKVRDTIEAEAETAIKDEDVVQTSYSYVHLSADEFVEDQLSEDDLKAKAEAIAASKDLDAAAAEQNVEVDNDTFTKAMSAKDAAEEFRSPIEVIKAVKALKNEGDISPVIPVKDDGFYVVRLDHLEDKDETHAEREDKISTYYTDTYNEWLKDLEWDINEKEWAKVTFDDVLLADPENIPDVPEEDTEEVTEEAAEEATEEAVEEATEEAATEAEEAAEEVTEEAAEEAAEETTEETEAEAEEEAVEDNAEETDEE